ncbi:MAG: hypothetical protein WBJ13_09320 [Sedimentibacter sp.]
MNRFECLKSGKRIFNYGTYDGGGDGLNVKIIVEATVDADKMLSIEVAFCFS